MIRTSDFCVISVWTGDDRWFDAFTENRAFPALCKPGNGIADAGKIAIDLRALFGCSVGFLYNGFVNKAKSLSVNCSPQSQTGRRTKRCWKNSMKMKSSIKTINNNKYYTNLKLTFRKAICRSCSELNKNVSNIGRNAESHNVVKKVSENSNSSGNCCSSCHVQSKNNNNNGLCSVVSLFVTCPSRSLWIKGIFQNN